MTDEGTGPALRARPAGRARRARAGWTLPPAFHVRRRRAVARGDGVVSCRARRRMARVRRPRRGRRCRRGRHRRARDRRRRRAGAGLRRTSARRRSRRTAQTYRLYYEVAPLDRHVPSDAEISRVQDTLLKRLQTFRPGRGRRSWCRTDRRSSRWTSRCRPTTQGVSTGSGRCSPRRGWPSWWAWTVSSRPVPRASMPAARRWWGPGRASPRPFGWTPPERPWTWPWTRGTRRPSPPGAMHTRARRSPSPSTMSSWRPPASMPPRLPAG